jgi:hypothetical protein
MAKASAAKWRLSASEWRLKAPKMKEKYQQGGVSISRWRNGGVVNGGSNK